MNASQIIGKFFWFFWEHRHFFPQGPQISEQVALKILLMEEILHHLGCIKSSK